MKGTWEERDCTAWSKSYLQSKLVPIAGIVNTIEYSIEGITFIHFSFDILIYSYFLSVEECDEIEGHAEIANVRGKPKFIFEFSLKLKFQVYMANGDFYKGKNSVKMKFIRMFLLDMILS